MKTAPPSRLEDFLRDADDLDAIAGRLAEGDFALLGEATHGTREFYETRQEISKRLIKVHGFRTIAIEGDWPDTLRIHRFVTAQSADIGTFAALGSFRRFPGWMWRNESMLAFVKWLHDWNVDHPADRAGIFGMDLYSLHSSIASVLSYLQSRDPEAAARARERYACFDHFGGDPQIYGFATERQGRENCEDEVVAQLVEMLHEQRALDIRGNEAFFAEQNARIVARAEAYYRAMYQGRDRSWNLRDKHMAETVKLLSAEATSLGKGAGVIVWAHNSHVGDARATEMGRRGELNLGQLLRESHSAQTRSLGFSTWSGKVTAAHAWDEDPSSMRVREALPDSYEDRFHETGRDAFWIDLHEPGLASLLDRSRLQRAIGIIYRPATERHSHYFETRLPGQFDLMLHIDVTSPVVPLGHEEPASIDRPHEVESEI